jgi:protein involved in polysaccharide export with SLBB domain
MLAQVGTDPYGGGDQGQVTNSTSGGQDSDCQDPTAPCASQRNDNSLGGNSSTGTTGSNMEGSTGGRLGGSNPGYGPSSRALSGNGYQDVDALPNQSRMTRNPGQYFPPAPPSEFQKFVASTIGQMLPIFGANLFRNVPATFAPVDQIPVPADAAVGPGDLLRIRIWGQVNFSADLRVDRSGDVYLPQVGPVHVAGLQYSELDEHLRAAIARVYRNFSVSAQLGQIRSIQVYVVGQARRPGTYTVSSLSTLVDTLFASGGPSPEGSLRAVQLKRAGKLVTTLDLYDLLVNGDKSGDSKLESGDVIYIPPVGPQIAVYGSVKVPAVYELGPQETVSQALEVAAGLTGVAGDTRLMLERMQQGRGRASEEIALTPEALSKPMQNGDLLRVTPAVPRYEKTVTLRGNTANPGRYPWHPGMHLRDLLPEQAALLTRNYWWQHTQLGMPAPEFLPQYGNGHNQQTLDRSRQTYNSPSRFGNGEGQQQQLQQQQEQQQQQQQPYDRSQQGEQDSDQQNDYPDQPEIDQRSQGGSRIAAEGALEQQQDRQNGFGAENDRTAALARRDVVTENTAHAGKLTDVTLSAPEIDWKYAVIERLDPQTLKTSLVPFDLGRLVMDHDETEDRELQPNDVITIFSQADIHVPVGQQTRLVRLEGEFVHAGVYSVKPGETLRTLVERAGGFADGAYLFGSEFSRVSVKAVQQRRLNDYIEKLELQTDRGLLSTSSAATASAAQFAGASVSATEARDLITRLQRIRATGRIVLKLSAESHDSHMLPELELEDGDTYYVPPVPSNISVIGAVYDQNSFVYTPGAQVRDYVHLAGGVSRDADKHHPFVIRADGSVISEDQIGSKNFARFTISPGDTIVISEKTFGPSKLRDFLNFSQLFSQLAIGAAVIQTL